MFPSGQQLSDSSPARFIYGHPQTRFQKGVHYNINGYMYRFIGMRYDDYGQRLPFLEMVSNEKVVSDAPPTQRTYAPAFVVTPHEPSPMDVHAESFVPQQYSEQTGQPPEAPEPSQEPAPLGSEEIIVKMGCKVQLGTFTSKRVIQFNDKNMPRDYNQRNRQYLNRIFNETNFCESLMEMNRKEPLLFICQIKRPLDSIGYNYAVVYDRNEQGHVMNSREIKDNHVLDQKVLCIDENGMASPQNDYDFSGSIDVRVLVVGHNGWLIFFAADRPWILTQFKYLVFTSPKSQVLFKRIVDTKRTDGKEWFIRQTFLSAQKPVDGMAIREAIVQRDTTKDGTFVVIGNHNSMIAMTQIQSMMKRGQTSNNYFDKSGAASSRTDSSQQSYQAPGPSTGAIPKRR